MSSVEETIAAVVTAPGTGGVAIVRLSGPDALTIADAMFQGRGPSPSKRRPGTFTFGHVTDSDGSSLDDVLCLVFRAPRSFTGEDAVEFQGHGGAVASRRVLARALDLGARMAEPGEFSRRAFLNGRMDLTQAEAVADLIHARSDRAATLAVDQLEGQLRTVIDRLYDRLVGICADLEATLDFPEDELPEPVFRDILARLDDLEAEITRLCSTWNEGHRLREGARVVISGRPNVGKSTLMNALLGRDRAIVSPHEGTTRDLLEETLVVGGVPVRLVDTAGLRDTACEIEREGVTRARRAGDQADLRILVLDATRDPTAEERAALTALRPDRDLAVWNKVDAGTPAEGFGTAAIPLSARTGEGLGVLLSAMEQRLTEGFDPQESHHVAVSERHRTLLDQARAVLIRARAQLAEDPVAHSVPAADDLREAAERLARITGRSYHEDLLDSIFARFCIGK